MSDYGFPHQGQSETCVIGSVLNSIFDAAESCQEFLAILLRDGLYAVVDVQPIAMALVIIVAIVHPLSPY